MESRPEFISTPLLQDIKKAAGSMEIEIAIGLESVSETIRNAIFLKGMSLRSYERSVETLRSNDMRTLSYVIIKPPFLTEGEGIEESISTARYAFATGSNVISLEPIGVETSSITEHLYKQGLFQPAKLWSMVYVMNETHSLGEIRLGGTQFAPRPTTLPMNCDDCTDIVVSRLETYNTTYSPSVLADLTCACKEAFERDVLPTRGAADEATIRSRLQGFIQDTFPNATRGFSPTSLTGCAQKKSQLAQLSNNALTL
jgi:radical SAM enzyme (TIGR01210 family)